MSSDAAQPEPSTDLTAVNERNTLRLFKLFRSIRDYKRVQCLASWQLVHGRNPLINVPESTPHVISTEFELDNHKQFLRAYQEQSVETSTRSGHVHL